MEDLKNNEENTIQIEEELKEITEDNTYTSSIEEKFDVELKELSDKEYKENLKELEEVEEEIKKELSELPQEEVEEHNKRIQERVKNLTDESIDKFVDNFIENTANVTPDQKQQLKLKLVNSLKTQQALVDDFEEEKKKISSEMEETEKKLSELFGEMKYSEVLKELEELQQKAIKEMNTVAYDYYVKLHKEISSIIYLTALKDNIKNIKNPSKLFTQCETNYEVEFKKFFNLLGTSKKYKFVNPDKLLACLTKYLKDNNEDSSIAKYFLFSFYRFFNSKGVEKVDKYSVMIEGIMKIIYSLNTDRIEEDEKNNFISNMKEYIDLMRK